MYNFYELEILKKVAENKSFLKSANDLFVSQSTVSSRIKSLEETVGTPLFIRDRHKVEITEAGKILLEYAQQIDLIQKDASTKVKFLLDGKLGEFSIATSHTLLDWILPEILEKFYYKYPKIKISISSSFTEETIQKVISGKVQFGFIRMPTPHFNDDRFFSKLIESDNTYFFTTPDNRIFRKDKIMLEDICKEQLLIYGSNTSYVPQLYSLFANCGIILSDLSERVIIDDISAVKIMVKLNKSIGYLPEISLSNEFKEGVFKKIEFIDTEPIKRYTFLICRKSAVDLPTEREFINFIDLLNLNNK